MSSIQNAQQVYFVGIGGIGMSAIARYFMHAGLAVAGYDRTSTPLTEALEEEGAAIHYCDDVALIPQRFLDPATTLVIYTPAVADTHSELTMFRREGYRCIKRSQCLGVLAEGRYVMAVSGTHGKTSTSTLTAWLNAKVGDGGCAFLGGISKNFDSNLVLGEGYRLAVEADEFDRSFLQLYPDAAVITSVDADHLDIYGTYEAVKEAFSEFASQIKRGGSLCIKEGVDIVLPTNDINIYRYSIDKGDFHAANIHQTEGGYYCFDIVCPDQTFERCTLGIPCLINVENAVAAVALLWIAAKAEQRPLDAELLREALSQFSGVKRRFEFYINTPKQVYMDDYAHHPRELSATLLSVKQMFASRHVTAIFQPHLYTRTRDLYTEFAEALSIADEVVLLPIYPAREEPIEGVTSQLIGDIVTVPYRIVERDALCDELEKMKTDVVITFGAGNIDACCQAIAERLEKRS